MSTSVLRLVPLAAALFVPACALSPAEPVGPPAKETIRAVTASNRLLSFNAGQPQKILSSKALTGLRNGDRLIGIDYRVAKGQLFGLGASGQLYRIDAVSAVATPVGSPVALPEGREFGFDFNPTVDRIRVVSDAGFNLRLHPDTGAAVDFAPDNAGFQPDGVLAYVAGDRHIAARPDILAAGYTYNADDEKLTTNYAIDGALGTLAMQGSREGASPTVSPNLGVLTTIGELGTGALADAHLDISDITNTALAALTPEGGTTQLYRVDLESGKASVIGPIGDGGALLGIAIEP
jgi:hypothetical protein